MLKVQFFICNSESSCFQPKTSIQIIQVALATITLIGGIVFAFSLIGYFPPWVVWPGGATAGTAFLGFIIVTVRSYCREEYVFKNPIEGLNPYQDLEKSSSNESEFNSNKSSHSDGNEFVSESEKGSKLELVDDCAHQDLEKPSSDENEFNSNKSSHSAEYEFASESETEEIKLSLTDERPPQNLEKCISNRKEFDSNKVPFSEDNDCRSEIKKQETFSVFWKQSFRPSSLEKFKMFTLELKFPDGRKQLFDIHNYENIEALLKIIGENIDSDHCSISIHFDWPTRDREVEEKMVIFQQSALAKSLLFSISQYQNRTIIVQPKPLKVGILGGGKNCRTYANGIVEIFISGNRDSQGTRFFPDGKKEQGKFDKESNKLLSGYRLVKDRNIEFVRPEFLAYYEEDSKKIRFGIFEVEGDLIVLEETHDMDYKAQYAISDVSLENVLIKASLRPSFGDGQSITQVLLQKDFENRLDRFLEHVLSPDNSGTPRLFGFSNIAAADVIEVVSKKRTIDPLKIIDPLSGRNFFIHAANLGSPILLKKLTELFPQAFRIAGQDVIAEFLRQGHTPSFARELAAAFEEQGGKLDTFHSMWLQIASEVKPNGEFEREFALLPHEKQRTLYDATFTYNNPFIHELPDVPIRADQYSINFMWINKNKMPVDQEFLIGNGLTSEQRKLDFQKEFVSPISKWAKANPGSLINIWVDGAMTTPGAIERSRELLQSVLEETSHGTIHFRDVRSMEIVRSNPEVFCDKMHVYFRVDLLRAIAADHILSNKETKYFVYADLDMKSLSGQELFDKRTISFLDDYGFVMAKGGHLGFENGFQILNGENRQFMDSHRKVIIDLSVEMALQRPDAIREQQIYDTYAAMITHFLDADGRYGKFKPFDEDETTSQESQDTISDTLRYFRKDRWTLDLFHLPLGERNIKLSKIMPTKPVRLPPSHF